MWGRGRGGGERHGEGGWEAGGDMFLVPFPCHLCRYHLPTKTHIRGRYAFLSPIRSKTDMRRAGEGILWLLPFITNGAHPPALAQGPKAYSGLLTSSSYIPRMSRHTRSTSSISAALEEGQSSLAIHISSGLGRQKDIATAFCTSMP